MNPPPTAARFWISAGVLSLIAGTVWSAAFARKDPGFTARFGLILPLVTLYALAPALWVGELVATQRAPFFRRRVIVTVFAVVALAPLTYVAGAGRAWARLPAEFDLKFSCAAVCFLAAALGGVLNALSLEKAPRPDPPPPLPPPVDARGPFRTLAPPAPSPPVPTPPAAPRGRSFWGGAGTAIGLAFFPGYGGMALLTYLTLLAAWEGRDRVSPPYAHQRTRRAIQAALAALVTLAVAIRP